MKRKIVKIDEEKCNGCGLCIDACHEGALQLIDGKAKLISESYCDGLGDCLPECPTGAITIEEREAEPFDEDAVKKIMAARKAKKEKEEEPLACGCPGTHQRALNRNSEVSSAKPVNQYTVNQESQLRQWPCQIKLVSPQAPFFDNSHLLVAADCTAYAYANFHQDFMRNKISIIGCPKLDDADYSEKLAAILAYNDIKSISVVRMEVPCCSGIVQAVKNALIKNGKMIPWNVTTISTDGQILDN